MMNDDDDDDIDFDSIFTKAAGQRPRMGNHDAPKPVVMSKTADGSTNIVDLDSIMGRKPSIITPTLKDDDKSARFRRSINDNNESLDPDIKEAIIQLLRYEGSDIHLVCSSVPKIRVDGELRDVRNTSVWDDDRMMAALKSMTDDNQFNEYNREHELDFAYSIGDPVNPLGRFRVNAYHDNNGACIALRIIPTRIKSVSQLGLPENLEELALLPRGLVLVCGPTGSGKSTTLAAIIDHANELRSDHIITVEDPIEFLYHHKKCIVNQREVGKDTPSFGEALKHALREDPDIIEIGEMRDKETISTALTAAETGHLVFGTLHTQDAPQTIDRIINVFPPEEQEQIAMMLSMSLKAVIVQTLVPKIKGGRACANEVMFNTSAIANLIRSHKTEQVINHLQGGAKEGMHTMDQSLLSLVRNGDISAETALKHAQNRKGLSDLLASLDKHVSDGEYR